MVIHFYSPSTVGIFYSQWLWHWLSRRFSRLYPTAELDRPLNWGCSYFAPLMVVETRIKKQFPEKNTRTRFIMCHFIFFLVVDLTRRRMTQIPTQVNCDTWSGGNIIVFFSYFLFFPGREKEIELTKRTKLLETKC